MREKFTLRAYFVVFSRMRFKSLFIVSNNSRQ